MSCMKRLKSGGHRTEPCGTPYVQVDRSVSNALRMSMAAGSIPLAGFGSRVSPVGLVL